MSAFSRAVELGADAVELDVHATRDGVVVVHHDREVRTPDIGTRAVEIRHALAAELQALGGGVEGGVTTLANVLDMLAGRVTVYVEIKGDDIEDLVLAAIRASCAPGRCAVHSFDHRAVKRARAAAPDIPGGLLLASSRLVDPGALLASADARDLWMHWEWVDAPLVEAVRAAGGRVIAWTPPLPADIEALVRADVDGLCVNDVRAVRDQLGELG